MKAVRFLVVIMLAIRAGSSAQCVSALQSVTYDTVVTGGGNSIYNFSFPKFNASSGTLVEVQIRSEVTLSFGFQLENTAGSSIVGYRVRVDRNDQITSDALLTPVDTTFPRRTYGPYTLTLADGTPGSGTDYHSEPVDYILNHTLIQRTVYNTADYLGIGNVDFEYTASSFTLTPSVPVTFNPASADTIRFSITYVVCPTWFLASDVSIFTARKKDDATVSISWITENESEDRTYILEKSNDGRSFQYVEKFKAFPKENQTGNYKYFYHPGPEEKGKIIFRLKQVEKNGKTKYSGLRVVELSGREKPNLQVYPNPGNGQVNILFHNQQRGDWVVEILSISGQLLERYNFRNTLLAKMDLRNKLSKGTYLLRTIHKRSGEQSVQKIIIQ
ncbi:MAG: T9SS type A sorting domain-containing protein [Chitinophagaceae bacterium]|nr:T9SS type A sorting domain-containing protein [Chitinophagaceae bacterium]